MSQDIEEKAAAEKDVEEAKKSAKKKDSQIVSRSADSRSVGSASKKRTTQNSQKIFNDIPLKQTQFAKGDDGRMIIKDPEFSLKELHAELKASMKESKALMKKYRKLKASCKFIITPVDTDEEK